MDLQDRKNFSQNVGNENCVEPGGEPTGRNYSRIKARRLAPPRRMTSSRSAGRRNGDPRFSENCHHVFRAFMQLVRWRQIWGTDARFDLLVPSTLTTATNLAGSTVAWQRNARFSENGESGGSIIAQRKESLSTVPVTPAFRPVSRCVRFCGGEPRNTSHQWTNRRVGALWAVVSRGRKPG